MENKPDLTAAELIKQHEGDFGFKINRYFPQLLLLVVLALMTVFLSLYSEHFFQWRNFRNILDQAAVYMLLSIGMTFILASGGVDLSVGSIAGLSGVVMAVLMKAGLPVFPAVLLGLLCGVLIGFCNGFIIARIKVNPFITTLAMMSIAKGIALILTGGVSIYGFPQSFKWWGTGSIGPINPPILLELIFLVVAGILFSRTLWGKYCLSMGGNGEALRRSGVNIKAYQISFYCASAFCAAVAGLIMTARLNAAAPLAGSGYEMDAIAAAVLGGAAMSGGKGSIIGTAIACLTLAVMRNGLTMLAVPTYYQQVVTGAIILLAVVIAELRNRRERFED